MPEQFTHTLPFDEVELRQVFDIARMAFHLTTNKTIAEALGGGVAESHVGDLRGTLELFMSRPVRNDGLKESAPELLASLEWITRCAKMPGPCGTTVYFINDATMDRAKAAVAKAKSAK